jgi:hypothetical protein
LLTREGELQPVRFARTTFVSDPSRKTNVIKVPKGEKEKKKRIKETKKQKIIISANPNPNPKIQNPKSKSNF